MERDEESGLSYHGARYYASWLARWTSCDPAPSRQEPSHASNLYGYARDNPIRYIDPDGRQERKPSPEVDEIPYDSIKNFVPLDDTPVPQLKEPSFPPWFTAEQRDFYKQKYSHEGTQLGPARIDPTTLKAIPDRGYTTNYEERVAVIGELAKTGIMILLPFAISRLPLWAAGAARGPSTAALTEAKLAESIVATEAGTGTVPSPNLAEALEQLQADGVTLRGNFINVTEGSPVYRATVDNGGAFANLDTGDIYVNIPHLESMLANRNLSGLQNIRQILLHEMGHVWQADINLVHDLYLDATIDQVMEARASMTGAQMTTNIADQEALLQHAMSRLEQASHFFGQP
jgi:RHS repeat-associated protein